MFMSVLQVCYTPDKEVLCAELVIVNCYCCTYVRSLKKANWSLPRTNVNIYRFIQAVCSPFTSLSIKQFFPSSCSHRFYLDLVHSTSISFFPHSLSFPTRQQSFSPSQHKQSSKIVSSFQSFCTFCHKEKHFNATTSISTNVFIVVIPSPLGNCMIDFALHLRPSSFSSLLCLFKCPC